jgi:putative intracellular protease/amidase
MNGSMCSGASLLAALGLLDGAEATTYPTTRAELESFGVTVAKSRSRRSGTSRPQQVASPRSTSPAGSSSERSEQNIATLWCGPCSPWIAGSSTPRSELPG